MPNRTAQRIEFGRVGRRVIEANFDGGDLSTDGGLMLLRRTDERIGLTRAVAAVFSDPRDPARITHRLRDLLAQRLYGLCCGYEDLNDHKTLRDDVLMQTAVGRDEPLASAPTFSRLENRIFLLRLNLDLDGWWRRYFNLLHSWCGFSWFGRDFIGYGRRRLLDGFYLGG